MGAIPLPDLQDFAPPGLDSERNCPFYGRHFTLMGSPFLLLGPTGNQCALVTTSYAPCGLEVVKERVDWRLCPRVDAVRTPNQG